MPIAVFGDVGSFGVNRDIPAHDLPEMPLGWSFVRNIRFKDGLAERVSGYAAGFDVTPTQASYGLFAATKVDGTRYIIGCGTNKVFDYTGSTENEITGSTAIAATADTKWTGGILSGIIVLNESTVAPQYITVANLGGATNLADLTNWPASTTCKALRPWKYFLVAGNMTEGGTQYPYKFRWSNSAVPGAIPTSWVASATNDAGSVDLSADDGEIKDMIPLGDQLAIYRETGIVMARYIGGTDAASRLVIAFNRVPVGSAGGMLANNCGCDVPGVGHVVLSANDVYVFDGTQIRSVIDGRMRRWLFSSIDTSNAKRSFVFNHASDSEVWICFPETSQSACNKAIIWNYKDNTFGVRDLPNATSGIHTSITEGSGDTWAALSGTWETLPQDEWTDFIIPNATRRSILSSADNKIYIIGNSNDNSGSPMTAEMKREYITLGDAQRVKYFRTVWPQFDGAGGQVVSVLIGTSMSPNETVSWQEPQNYTLGSSRKIDVNRSGRYLSIAFRSSSGAQWRLRRVDVDFQPQGLW